MIVDYLQPGDLVGCRYRLVQAQRHPNIAPTAHSQIRQERLRSHRAAMLATFPDRRALGDTVVFRRFDVGASYADPEQGWLDTLEALAHAPTIITEAMLELHEPTAMGSTWYIAVDALVRHEDRYIPIIISNHRVARLHKEQQVWSCATSRLGLGSWQQVPFKIKNHAYDSFALALATRALATLDLDAAFGGLVGQDSSRAYFVPVEHVERGLDNALQTPVPTQALRIKECGHCRYSSWCTAELEGRDDVSLFIRGQQASQLKAEGIHTVDDLIHAGRGEQSQMAQAWRANIALLRRDAPVAQLRRDIEIDVDVEAYLDSGAYLWGTYDGQEYRPFATWGELGGAAEAANFADFWRWLQAQQAHAKAQGKSFGVYCYSAHGENHWLRFSARRFAGKFAGVPSEEEIAAFIASDAWIDVYAAVEQQLCSPFSLGLKAVAHEAGFYWQTPDIDGEASVEYFQRAQTQLQARADLLSYNGDDCRATAVVRSWLATGTPELPRLADITPALIDTAGASHT
ncbi:MAG: TM0106 family RecB-like putative nuclease [Corynebacterium sp.]|nr:TM0106 family RecB-like putative nuclease [Corynebacterium sp.]